MLTSSRFLRWRAEQFAEPAFDELSAALCKIVTAAVWEPNPLNPPQPQSGVDTVISKDYEYARSSTESRHRALRQQVPYPSCMLFQCLHQLLGRVWRNVATDFLL